MVGIHLRQQQANFVSHLHDQGIVDNNLDNFLSLGDGNPGLVVEIFTGYLQNTDNSLAEITVRLNEDEVDFEKAGLDVHQIKGSTSSMGGRKMYLEVVELQAAFKERNKEKCLGALAKVKQEYEILKNNLAIISEMESNITANEAIRRGRA